MFIRGLRLAPLLAPEGEGGGGGDDLGGGNDLPEGQQRQGANLDPYNEVRKTQRLLKKEQAERQELQNKLAALEGRFSKHSELFDALENRGKSNELPTDPTKIKSDGLLARARQVHQQLSEQGGLPLTVESAELIQELLQQNEQLKKKFGEVEQQTQNQSRPEYHAEQYFAVTAGAIMNEELEALYGDNAIANENRPDFDRVAIKRFQDMKAKGGSDYLNLLRDPARQKKFIQDVISSKMPKAYNTRDGFKALDSYSLSDAQRDMELVQSGKIKDRNEASRLQAKARQRMLPIALGLERA